MSAHHNPIATGPGHENSDASVKLVVIVLAILGAGAAAVCFLVYGIFVYLADHPLTTAPPNPMAETATQQFPPAPRLQEHPSIEIDDLHQQEEKILTTYGWTDKNAGIVRIPIDRAMDLALQRGFATQTAAKTTKAAPK